MSPLRLWLFILSVSGVTILNIFVNGALIIALPTMGKALHFTESEMQWPLNVYALSYGSLLLLSGRIADVIGNKRMFLFGTGWFTIWSFATAVSPNKYALIVFIALTGVGAAANTPTGIGIFAGHFRSGKVKNRAITALGAGQAIGYIVGLIGGGFLCQTTSLWRVIFYIQGGMAAVFFVLGVVTIPADQAHTRYKLGIDWVGAFLSVSGLGLLTFILSESTAVRNGWRTPWVPVLLVVSLAILVLFVLWEAYRERHGKSVIMPVSIWSIPGAKMGPVVGVVFLAWASYNALSYFVTLYYQEVRLLRPAETSLQTLPFAIVALIANVVTGWLLGRVRGDVLIAVGLLGTMIAPLVFTLMDIHASYWRTGFLVMIFISWTDVAYTVGNLQLSISFKADSRGASSTSRRGSLTLPRMALQLGTSISLALTSSVANAVSESYNARHPELSPSDPAVLEAGFRVAGWMSFGLTAASFLLCVLGMRGIGVIGRAPSSETEAEKSKLYQSPMASEKTLQPAEQVQVLTVEECLGVGESGGEGRTTASVVPGLV
ncbi:major facilitator superfamily domain-containing protein [Fomitopsis serialis]|uniref:major facilitator superfamily domain-containing protein n=1 Tax=Fomitopsis serialis TaxID=139415 RepID=UPI002007E2E5|nr:major facilitator superfamily domain-containing protein [Neoantrodia serialis]KAH9934303.1 major facilitator superfamily domain-containing protein [Neoantrodia serialis]